jgi:general secretion pathway protein K
MATGPTGAGGRERGFALLVVLWIVTLLALQVSIFNLTVRDAGALAGNEMAIARGEALTSAGVELAAARLAETDAEWRWDADGSTRQVSFGGARLYITITDEAGRFDINEIDGEVADSLLRPYGGSADALTQWIDRNGPLLDPSQLQRALGLSSAAMQALEPYLTVHGGDGKINALVAPREVLLSLPGANAADVDRALKFRQRGLMSAQDVARALSSVDKWLTERTGPAYRVEVAVRGESTSAIGWAEATILLGKDAKAPFRVLSWRYEPRSMGDRGQQVQRGREKR